MQMSRQSCFLMGHRDAPGTILPELLAALERHIAAYGVTEFLVGQRGVFDRLATKAVMQLKEKHPCIRLVLLLPYHPGERKTVLPDGFDASLYPEGQETVPRRLAILRANQYAVRHCGYMIAYAWQPGSNTRKLTEWAQKRRGMQVTVIGRGEAEA